MTMEKRIIKRIGDNNDDVSLHVLLLAVDHDQISVVLQTPVSGRTPPRLVLVVVVLNIRLISTIIGIMIMISAYNPYNKIITILSS